MKKIIYSLSLLGIVLFMACNKLDVPSQNIVQDKDLLTSQEGVTAYMARLYSLLPVEDFKFGNNGFNHYSNISNNVNTSTGEAYARDAGIANFSFGYWDSAYEVIRYANYFLEHIDEFESNFANKSLIPHWKAEARFIRAYTYFALVKRYGGVPILTETQQYPAEKPEDLQPLRDSEQAVYDLIEDDLNYAIQNLLDKSEKKGRVNKHVAAAFKSRMMLFAGSIAKYNEFSLFDDQQTRVIGISSTEAVRYFKASYDAAKATENVYSLYMGMWAAGDKEAQRENYANLFLDKNSPENIFVKQAEYPNITHSFDSYSVPGQLMGPDGYSAFFSPTLDFVEMFEGFPKTNKGTINVMDENGKHAFFDHRLDLFINAEPRLRASVIVPGDEFKGEKIDVRRGVYTGSVGSGITKLSDEGTTAAYNNPNIKESPAFDQQVVVTLPDGTKMNAAGASGFFKNNRRSSATGFYLRKYLNPKMTVDQTSQKMSDQDWIEMRYAEVLLNRAEAAFELLLLGESDVDYQTDAYECINKIRVRAGATVLKNISELSPSKMVEVGSLSVPEGLQIIRTERRKELFFENKTWWDMKRWRTADQELNNQYWRMLNPFYVTENGKYIFDVRFVELNRRYTFNVNWYYERIPAAEINKNNNLIQNSGY